MSNRYPLSPWIKFSCALGVLVVLTFAVPSQSAIFKWKDENGKTHFTDSLSKIPPQYREKGKLKTMDGKPAQSSKPAPTSNKNPVEDPGPKAKPVNHVIKAKSRQGGHYVVEVVLNGTVRADLVVDTGATMIILSDSVGKRLGIRKRNGLPKVGFNTAGGTIEAPLFVLDSLKVGSAEALNLEASINPYMGGMDGLLGMAFLGEFRMEMNQENSELILKPLGNPEDEYWDGKNEKWWKNKYKTYADNLRELQKAAKQVRSNYKVLKRVKKLIRHYRKLHNALEERANIAGLPMEYRYYP